MLAPTMEFAPQPSSIPHCGSYTRPHRSTVSVKPNTTTPTIRPAQCGPFLLVTHATPRTPPRGLNLWARDPRPVEYGSIWSIRCPDTRQSTTRWTREPPIWTDPPRSDASWRNISERSRAVKSTGTTLERQLTAAAAAAGGPIAQLNPPDNCRGITKTRTRLCNIAYNN